jgi:hypothetical protein
VLKIFINRCFTEGFNFEIIIESIFYIVYLGVLIFEGYLFFRLINPKKSKLIFTNFNRGFHPIFIDEDGKNQLSSFLGPGFFCFFVVVIYNYFQENSFELISVINIYAMFCAGFIFSRYEVLTKFPIYILKIQSLKMNVKYEDYLHHKIVDDEPHLKVNQFLMPLKKEYPRTSEEKETIELRNYETPANPALVTKIVDFGLSKIIDDGYNLKVRVVAIKDFGELEIEMWLE